MTSSTPMFSRPQTLTLLSLQLSTTFSSRSLPSDNKNSWDGHISPTNKNFGPLHQNEHSFNLLPKHTLVQISAGFNAVGTWNQFLQSPFSRIFSALFCTQTFHSLCTCHIHHNTIWESVEQNTISTSLSTAIFTDAINLFNKKYANDSNIGIEMSFTGASLNVHVHSLTITPCSLK